jgi:hypothetical protein
MSASLEVGDRMRFSGELLNYIKDADKLDPHTWIVRVVEIREHEGYKELVLSNEAPVVSPVYQASRITERRRFVDGCPTCEKNKREMRLAIEHHDASPRCRSGKASHCACSTCF